MSLNKHDRQVMQLPAAAVTPIRKALEGKFAKIYILIRAPVNKFSVPSILGQGLTYFT